MNEKKPDGSRAVKDKDGVGDFWQSPFELWGEIKGKVYPADSLVFDPCPDRSRILPGTWVTSDKSDGLNVDWRGPVFLNPPFSDIGPWIEKAVAHNDIVSFLIPVRSDSWWWHKYAHLGRIIFIRGRVKYVAPIEFVMARRAKGLPPFPGPSAPSCVLVFGDGTGPNDYWTPACHLTRDKKRKNSEEMEG